MSCQLHTDFFLFSRLFFLKTVSLFHWKQSTWSVLLTNLNLNVFLLRRSNIHSNEKLLNSHFMFFASHATNVTYYGRSCSWCFLLCSMLCRQCCSFSWSCSALWSHLYCNAGYEYSSLLPVCSYVCSTDAVVSAQQHPSI